MVRNLGPRAAAALALLLLVLAGWSLTIRAPAQDPTAHPDVAYSDLELYHAVAERVAAGENYYAGATALQRTHKFPTKPFVTVRLPTLALLAATVGWTVLHLLLVGVMLAGAAAWHGALARSARPAERVAVAGLLLAGGAMAAAPWFAAEHELWAGALLSLALAARVSGRWPLAVLAAAAALAIRELALPFVLLALVFAVAEGRRREAAAWAGLIAAFLGGLALHARAVAAHVLPGDIVSPGWDALRGPAAALRDLADVSLLHLAPAPLCYLLALLPLMGWIAAPPALSRFAVPLYAGYLALLALFARDLNFYWAIMLLPGYFAGFAFLPRLVRDLRHALLAGRPARL